MKSPQRSDELQAFQAWLQRLSWEQLRDASTIAFPRDTKTHQRNTELDLLHEMLNLQPPPPVPIHARAIPYRPVAARDPCTDGRNQDERNFRGRFRNPSWFQWVERKSRRSSGKSDTLFEVYSKRFMQPDGAIYTLGSTQQQRDADETLLQHCVFVEPVTESTTTYIQLDVRNDPRLVIHLLRVASRGGFASAPPSTTTNTQSPWLDPTQRWFSLPMFLASRFELALWKSYRSKSSLQMHPWPLSLVEELSSATIAAIVSKIALQFWKQQLQIAHEHKTTLMDSVLWKLLVERQDCIYINNGGHPLSPQSLLDSLVRCPLVTPFDMSVLREFRQKNREALHQEFLKAIELSLMLDFPSSTLEIPKNTDSAKKSKRRNKKKKVIKTRPTPAPTVIQEDGSNSSSDRSHVCHDREIEPCLEESLSCNIEYLSNGTSGHDWNQVTALDSFVKVGLEPDLEAFQIEHAFEGTVAGKKSKIESEKQVSEPLDENHVIEESIVASDMGNVMLLSQPSPRPDSPAVIVEEYSSSACQQFEASNLTFGLPERVVNDWSKQKGFSHRNESLLTDFFQSQHDAASRGHHIQTSSIAASLDPSCTDHLLETPDLKDFASKESHQDTEAALSTEIEEDETEKVVSREHLNDDDDLLIPIQKCQLSMSQQPNLETHDHPTDDVDDQSLSPSSTPSPLVSPIHKTPPNINGMQRETSDSTKRGDTSKTKSMRSNSSAEAQSISAKSEPNQALSKATSSRSIDGVRSPGYHEIAKINSKKIASLSPSLVQTHQSCAHPSRSRDDQDIRNKGIVRKSVDVLASYRNVVSRPLTARDDHDIGRVKSGPKSLSYRAVVAKAPARSVSYSKPTEAARFPFNHFQFETGWWKGKAANKTGAQSDTTFDIHDDYQNWPDLRQSQGREDGDNNTKDGSTTITSALSNRDTEDVLVLREERDAYRDMCLTLGAEVAKLKNVVAAQKSLYISNQAPTRGSLGLASGPFDTQRGGIYAFERVSFSRRQIAMSDAGFRIDYESQASEDEAAARLGFTENSREISSAATHVDSDVSLDHTTTNVTHTAVSVPAIPRYGTEPSYFQGMRSRLTNDMFRFLHATDLHLKKQEPIKAAAIERMTRLVNTMWPRAQVKLYGSNVTGLSLPTSDLDFVICLPAVHKKAVAVAPGVLEGRNAINESSQKLLARTLKGESWIDPRSMKLVERTVVPVIKVSTKDTKARSLQLDITFDGPRHHGLEAIQMVNRILDELPVLRPLLLVLKQFLSNRSLLTAYTGGLSTYGLFLMVARYLQEQESWGDCGSLLMGFLDFYGNNFDPRSTGISVKNRQYFSRFSGPIAVNSVAPTQVSWRPLGIRPLPTTQFFRRYSFSDKGTIDAHQGANPSVIVRQAIPVPVANTHKPPVPPNGDIEHAAMPYTLDPLLIEDPLNESNNVGRNAFRIFSVLRAFSDAHRALVASLEWDLQSTAEFQDDGEYPLLRCLLQNEDVVFNDIGR